MSKDSSLNSRQAPAGGYFLKEGELADNSSCDFFSCIGHSIFEGKHSTTYKFGFLKSLLDNLFDGEWCGDRYVIDLKKISSTFTTIYWNAVAINKIPQMPLVKGKEASGVTKVIADILTNNPSLEANFESLSQRSQEMIDRRVSDVFKRYVVGAFYYDTQRYIYGFSKKSGILWLNKRSLDFLAAHKTLIDQVNYYEWLKMCEKILRDNNREPIPYLSTKLEEITKRVNLKPFKEALERDCGGNAVCFYCGKTLRKGDCELDHVIPWSFIKSDSEWNFVFACRSCNNSKRDSIPASEYLDLVEKRNKRFNLGDHDMKALARIAMYNGVKGGWKPKKG